MAFWIIVTVLTVPAIGMSIFAWSVVGGVRAEAAVTDARLRELAWTMLAYADTYGGFPMSESEVRAFTVPLELRSRDGVGFPHTRAEATEASAVQSLDACLTAVEVEWPAVRDVQPILRSKGKPTLQGTMPTIGQWLFAMTQRIRAAQSTG